MNLIGNINAIPFRRFRGGGGAIPPFLSIPGTIARYSALGLTNEEMSKNPVWVDKTGNGHDLQMKNFSWKGMSGVGGYVGDFSKWVNNRDTTEIGITKSNSKVIIDVKVSQGLGKNIVFISKSNLGISNNVTIKITSTYPEGVMKFANSASNKYLKLPSNGIITLQDNPEYTSNEMHLHLASADLGQITIEQLPLYPGALVFDGVDDYGVCDNFPILTKEKGYTVVALRQYLFNATDKISSLVTNAPSSIVSRSTLTFELIGSKGEKINFSFGKGNPVSDFEPNVFSYMTSKSYNGKTITPGDVTESNKRILVGNFSENGKYGSNVAIWELVFLDHDATEEELTKIKDYFVKTYPWLFPDQAWTVTGKTNEDEDRATIANITGNGNDLVLSNFGFAGNSGYGEYGANYNDIKWIKPANRADITWTSYSINITSVKAESTQFYYQSRSDESSFTVPSYVIKVYGLKDGQTLSYRQLTPEGWQLYRISEDGIYTLPSFLFKANGDWYGFILNKVQESCDITIEQIPEYEGYLVTDGVDDTGRAVGLTISKDFTLVGEWILFSKTSVNAGLSIHPQIHIFNQPEAIKIVFRTAGKTLPVKSLKAICSDGRCYDENWSELKINVGEFTNNKGTLFVASNGTNYAQIAFKNLGIYDNHILSKDDCIKAYNYLQTLKAK